jgi:hypothetical protein
MWCVNDPLCEVPAAGNVLYSPLALLEMMLLCASIFFIVLHGYMLQHIS